MLRTVLKVLLALSLLVQGGLGAFAADSHGTPANQYSSQHDGHGKMPCCPDSATQDHGMATCPACCAAFIAPAQFTPPSIELLAAFAAEITAAFASSAPVPPNPPPIA